MKKRKIYKRSLVVFTILLVIGVVFYTIFNCINVLASSSVKREIAKEIQKIKKIGEPTTIEELVPVEISDEENGALVYRKAFEVRKDLAKKYKKEEKYIPYEGAVTWDKVPEGEKVKVKNLILYNPDYIRFYQLLEKASQMKCQFLKRKDWEKGMGILLPHLRYLRDCARLLAAKAKIQAENKNIEGSLSTCLTGLRISKSLSNEPLIINQLVRIAMDSIILRELGEVLKKGEASIKIYQILIKEIEKERSDMMVYPSFNGERVVFGITEFSSVRRYAEKNLKKIEKEKGKKLSNEEIIEEFYKIKVLGQPVIGKKDKKSKEYKEFTKKMKQTYGNSEDILEDFFDNQELYYLRTMAKMIALVKEPYWEVREELKGFDKGIIEKLPQEKAILTQMLLPALSRAYNKEARIDAQLGNAEIALACRIYKARCGKYPESLNELTPGILPSLPLDPFTGKNYIYKRKLKGFIVYSLGDNLKDDGGKSQRKMRWRGDFDIIWEE